MVNLVIGKINSGKSRFLEAHYARHQEGDGFVSRKIIDADNMIGFQSLRLTTGEALMWMIHERYYRHDFINPGRIGPYYYNADLLFEIIRAYEEMIEKSVTPIYLDEVGQMELDGQGFDTIMKRLAFYEGESYIAVRRHLVNQVIDKYGLSDVRLIDVEEQ